MSSQRHAGPLVGGALLIAFGVLALLGQLFRGNFWNVFWPFFIIGIGGMFFVGMIAGGKSVSGLAIPGTIVSVIGLMLLYQNLTGYWESWSYGWTVILMSVGLGIFLTGAYEGNAHRRRAGLRVNCYPELAKLPKQFKFADRMGIPLAIVLGPDEQRRRPDDAAGGDSADRDVGDLDERLARRDGLRRTASLRDLERPFLNLDDRQARMDVPARVEVVCHRLDDPHVKGRPVGQHGLRAHRGDTDGSDRCGGEHRAHQNEDLLRAQDAHCNPSSRMCSMA